MAQKKHTLLLLIGFIFLSMIHGFAQDFHQREAKPVEEILYNKDPNKAKAMFNKDRYLVLENLRNGNRVRFYKGNILRFRTKDHVTYEDDIYDITDSSIVITSLNEVMNRYEYVEIKLSDISRVYKRPKKKLHFGIANFAPFGYLLIEWVAWNVNPIDNPKLPLAAGLTAASPLFTVLQNSIRSRKLRENYRLRVLQGF